MDEILFFLKRKIFFLYIFNLLINFSFSYLEFKFPYAFKLKNKNIFVIHQLGVSICNNNFTEIISEEVTFSNSEKIATDEALSKVTSVSADGYYIICLINDKIYIFDGDGYFLKKSTNSITSLTVEYYSLEYFTLIDNYIYFAIGFISNQKLYLYSYTYNVPSKVFEAYSQYQYSSSSYNIVNSGLSCHYMSSNTYGHFVLFCLCGVKYNDIKNQIALNYFDITDQDITLLKRKYLSILHEIKYIKSTLLPDCQNLFVGFMSSNGIAYHWKYNINMDSTTYNLKYFNNSYCKLIPHGFKYNYYPEKSELIYTCLLENDDWTVPNAKILVANIYFNDSQKSYSYKYNDCDLHGYSIIYLDSENDYYIISDAECSNTLIPFDVLFDIFKEETTIITEVIELEEKEEEMETCEKEEENIESSNEEEENNYITIIEEQKENDINIIQELEKVDSTFLEEKETMKLTDMKDDSQFNESNISYICPEEYIKLPHEEDKCKNDCISNDNNKYEFKNVCYDLSSNILNKIDHCDILCSAKNIFEILEIKNFETFCNMDITKNLFCFLNYKGIYNNSREQNIELQDIILEKIEKGFISNDYNTESLDEGKGQVLKFNKMEITLTTTETQKKMLDHHNLTGIDFTECEKLLRKFYNIAIDKKLYMMKIDMYQERMKIPKIEYDVYSKLNDTNLIKLNISICKNINIDLSIPAFISEKDNIDEYNKSSGYYNDLCYPAQSESNTDIIIKDRQKEFIDKNKTVCQENCDFTEYNYNTKKAKCSCKVEESSSSSINMVINITEIYQSFKDIKNMINIEIVKCYKILFTKKGIIKNIAFYLIILLLFLHFIFIIIFYCKDSDKIKKRIGDIVFAIKNWDLVIEEEKEKNTKSKKLKNDNSKNKEQSLNINEHKRKRSKYMSSLNTDNAIIQGNKQLRRNRKINSNNRRRKSSIDKSKTNSLNSTKNQLKNSILNREVIIKKTKKIMEYNQEEKNKLIYVKAIKFDKRTYCEYYISLIQTKHVLVFSFYYNSDYNSRIIKIDLFFNRFVIYFTINALFFNDETVHQIYDDKGKYQLLYQLPQIIYSTLISSVLDILLKILALSENSIIELKNDKSKKNLNQREKDLKNKLTIKFIMYFILTFIYLLLFWYYLSIFCAIYINTQIHLIKDTLLSFGLSFIDPFFLYLIPGLFRIPALSNKKDQRICLYNISKLFQMFL